MSTDSYGFPGAQLFAVNGVPIETRSFNEILEMFRTRSVPTSLTFIGRGSGGVELGAASTFLREAASSASSRAEAASLALRRSMGAAAESGGGVTGANGGGGASAGAIEGFEDVSLDSGGGGEKTYDPSGDFYGTGSGLSGSDRSRRQHQRLPQAAAASTSTGATSATTTSGDDGKSPTALILPHTAGAGVFARVAISRGLHAFCCVVLRGGRTD